MTYKAYIEAVLAKFNISTVEVEVIMLDNGISEMLEVDIAIAKKAIHQSLSVWLPVQSSVSEGGVSVSWNLDAIKHYYANLCNELGVENKFSESIVRDKSNLW
jgi:hypothetical protein